MIRFTTYCQSEQIFFVVEDSGKEFNKEELVKATQEFYQGKGLGRILLRAGMNFAKNKSYGGTILCVNADNEKAKSLYIQEGYKQVEAVVCYYLDCN